MHRRNRRLKLRLRPYRDVKAKYGEIRLAKKFVAELAAT